MRIILALLALSGCATAPQIVDSACQWVRPIYVTSEDQISEPTSAAILSHDEKWRVNCGGQK